MSVPQPVRGGSALPACTLVMARWSCKETCKQILLHLTLGLHLYRQLWYPDQLCSLLWISAVAATPRFGAFVYRDLPLSLDLENRGLCA